MESTGLYKTIQDTVGASLVATTRSASKLADEDLDFHRSANPLIGINLDRQNARLLGLANRLLAHSASSSGLVRPQLEDSEDVDLNWTEIVDVVDSLLEKADTTLDEFSGVLKRLSPSKDQDPVPRPAQLGFNAFRNQDLSKPQLLFDHVPHNQFNGPFQPLLTNKPHAIVPFEESAKQIIEEDGSTYYPHPYRTEVEQYQYPPTMYIESEPIPYQPFEGTQATLVETPEALEQMLEELKGAKEIAIDLEHHDSRSYIGLVSLMQISTRHKDWIIDTLKPWRRKLEVLNEVFTDPNILKVLHGSYMDNIWLQRDFGLYLVGVFDTFHAATALGYSGRSLAFLLMRFINFQAQKQYQTADWRMRPLPRELFDYARSDTHFLLYIYDCMRNELIRMSSSLAPEQSKIRYVLDNSKQYCLQQYENPFYDVTYGGGHSGWYKLLDRTPSIFSREQFSIFRAVHQWRDELARKLDESTGYILTNYSLFNLAKTIPKDEAGLFSAIQPISSPVRARKNELLGLIAKANIDGRDGPAMADVFEWLQPRQDDAPKLPAPTSSSAPTLPAPDANSNNSNTISFSSEGLQSLRSNTSHFWGGILNAPNWDQRRNFATESIRLALPLPKLTAEIFKDPAVDSHMDHNSPQAPKDPGVVAEVPHRRAKERESIAEANNTSSTNEVFILRQSGGKRKRGHNSSVADPEAPLNYDDEEQAGADQADTLALPGEETSPARKPAWRKEQARGRKAMRKAEKQASQETLRMAEGGGDGPSRAAAESELFDYDNAPSVLHAQTGEKAGKGKKGFNPYAKAADAPKGLGRAQKEKAGRSGTFTS